VSDAPIEPADTFDYIEKDFSGERKDIEKQIGVIEVRQQEIMNRIADIDQNILYLQGLIQQGNENKDKIRAIRGAIGKNIDTLAKLYSIYREYEDTKQRYHKILSDNMYKMHHLISVDIRRIDEKLEKMGDQDFFGVFSEFVNIMSGKKECDTRVPITEDINKDLGDENPDYKL
jgi:chromosome segregation ATPase